MKRRDFLVAAAVFSAAGALRFCDQQRITATVSYPGRDLGHWLRDSREIPPPDETIDTEILIAGSGIAGLTAAWQLAKRGLRDVLIVPGPETHGNAAAGQDGELIFPTGAHYLPLPSQQSWHMREMLSDFDIIQKDPFSERPTYDERYLVHGPAERVLYRGAWQEGYLPSEGLSAAERDEHSRFFSIVDHFTAARGGDGRRAFAVPLEQSSIDARFLALDRITFKTWLDRQQLHSPTLRWYLDYCCRDDYGRHDDEVSAWAGLHYFCSRESLAANAERGAVLTWPQGLAAVARQLEDTAGIGYRLQNSSVAELRVNDSGVQALCVALQNGRWRSFRVTARHAIAAMPLYVLQHVLIDGSRYGFAAGRDVPPYAPWMVSNFIMNAFPEEQPGSPLSWDNVVYREPGLGFVVSTHQEIRLSRPPRTAFTAYRALSQLEPSDARRWLEQASIADLARSAAEDLRLAYGWRLPLCVQRLEITVRGHGMAVPQPGFLSNPGRSSLRGATGRLVFAHSDLSGLSLFEEAAWWGYRAAVCVAGAVRS